MRGGRQACQKRCYTCWEGSTVGRYTLHCAQSVANKFGHQKVEALQERGLSYLNILHVLSIKMIAREEAREGDTQSLSHIH